MRDSRGLLARWRALSADWLMTQVQRLGRINPYLLFLLPALYLATHHVTQGRHPIQFSYAPNAIWSYEWAEQFRQGFLYPRWMEHTYAGLGSPTFNFYGPFCMYMTLPFSVGLGLSVSTSVLWSFWVALLVLGLGMVRLCSSLFPVTHRWLSVLIAVMAMLSPYTLLNVYSRGAFAETWAMALLPWLLNAVLESLESACLAVRFRLIALAAAYALCHPPSLLIGTASIGFSLIVISRNWADVVRAIRRAVVPIASALVLDALYLMPAIGDQQYANVQFLTNGGGQPAAKSLIATEIGRLSLKFLDGYAGSIVPSIAFLCLTCVLVAWLLRRHGDLNGKVRTRRLVFLLASAALAAMMMTDLAGGIYELLPPLNMIQFSTRWMVVLTVAAMPLWGYIVLVSTRANRPHGTLLRIPVWLVTLWMSTNAFSTVLTYVDWNKGDALRTDALFRRMKLSGREADASATPIRGFRGLLHINAKDELVLEDVIEYQPFPKSDGQLPPRTFDLVEWEKGEGTISGIDWSLGHRKFIVDSKTGGWLLLRTSAWLGWQVTVNQETSVGDNPGDWGRMLVAVPPGHSAIRVDYRGTPNQRLGQVVSIAMLVLLMAYAVWTRGKERLAWRIG